jgi:hypothetical protein
MQGTASSAPDNLTRCAQIITGAQRAKSKNKFLFRISVSKTKGAARGCSFARSAPG